MTPSRLRSLFMLGTVLAASPVNARFLQVDPVGYDDQINLYAYVMNDPLNGMDPTGTTCTQDQDKGSWTCKIDDPGKLTEAQQAEANKKYTDAVNKLMADPNAKVTIGAQTQTGSRIPLTERITQGEIGLSLIQANVTYSDKSYNRPDGSMDRGIRAMTEGELGTRPIRMTLYPRALRENMTELPRTFVHEGAHPTQGDYRLYLRYLQSGGTDWANDHQEFYRRMAEEVLGR